MKEKIIEVLRECPNGLRLREIAMYLRCNRFALLNDINELYKAGIIVDVTVENFVQERSPPSSTWRRTLLMCGWFTPATWIFNPGFLFISFSIPFFILILISF